MSHTIKAVVLAGISCLALPGLAQAQSTGSGTGTDPASAQPASEPASQPTGGVLRLSTGINYSRGDYGDVLDTTVVSAPVGLKYSRGNFSVRVSVPFVSIDGPGSLIDTPQGRDAGFGASDNSGSGSSNSGSGSSNSGSGSSGSNSGSGSSGSSGSGSGGSGSSGSGSGSTSGGAVTVPAAPASTGRRSGIGDVSVTMAYAFPLGETTSFDVTARVKLPTASTAKRLGTGQVDFTLGGDLSQDLGNATLWVGGRRRFVGKPAGSTLRDVWALGGGASLQLDGGTIIGADYDWQQSTSALNGDSSEVTGWVNFRLSRKLRLQVFASTGFTTNSTDLAGGISLSWRLN